LDSSPGGMGTAYPINVKELVMTKAILWDPWSTPFLLVSNITKRQGLLSMGQYLKMLISRARLPFAYRQVAKGCWDIKSPLNAIWPLQLQISLGPSPRDEYWEVGRISYRYWTGTKSTKTPNTTFLDKILDTVDSQSCSQYQKRNAQRVTGSNPIIPGI
jgi:hypothetical protein